MKEFVYLVAVCISFSNVVLAQIPELDVRTDKALESSTGIEKARFLYEKGEYTTAEAMLYSELEKGKFVPHDFLLFANTLNVNNKPALAQEFYKEYAKASGKKTTEEQINQLFNNAIYPANPIITNYPITNPTTYQNKLYTEINGLMIMYDQDCDGNLKNRTEVMQGVTDMPFGSIAYFDNGNKAVASVVSKSKKTTSLYLLYKKKGKWKKPSKIFDGDANYAFPFMDVNTNTLYFSSDKDGGYGGYDVYISNYNGSSFDNPINMGDQLNSPGNDINPTLTEDWLYISSNGHVSKGGYDLYKYKNLGDFNIIFLNCTELNTQANELALVPQSRTKFLITRESNGTSQLMSIDKPKVMSSMSGNVIDQNGVGIPNAYVMMNATEGMGIFAITDVNGNFVYKTDKNIQEYAGKVLADGYESKTFNTALNENASVQLTKIKPVEIVKVVEKQVQTSSASEATSTMVETTPLNTEVTSQASDVILAEYDEESETSASRPDRGHYYIIIGSTYNYAQAYDFWTTWLPSFNGAEILEYGNGLYRIGFYAGANEEQAMQSFNESKGKKKDIWILRPKN